MVGLVFADVAEVVALDAILSAYPTPILRLYQNNYTPVDGSVRASFTEATFSGYAQAHPTMGFPTEISGVATTVATAAAVFTAAGIGTTNTIYGYYVMDTTDTTLLWAERFPAPISIAANGNSISITLQLTLDSANH